MTLDSAANAPCWLRIFWFAALFETFLSAPTAYTSRSSALTARLLLPAEPAGTSGSAVAVASGQCFQALQGGEKHARTGGGNR